MLYLFRHRVIWPHGAKSLSKPESTIVAEAVITSNTSCTDIVEVKLEIMPVHDDTHVEIVDVEKATHNTDANYDHIGLEDNVDDTIDIPHNTDADYDHIGLEDNVDDAIDTPHNTDADYDHIGLEDNVDDAIDTHVEVVGVEKATHNTDANYDHIALEDNDDDDDDDGDQTEPDGDPHSFLSGQYQNEQTFFMPIANLERDCRPEEIIVLEKQMAKSLKQLHSKSNPTRQFEMTIGGKLCKLQAYHYIEKDPIPPKRSNFINFAELNARSHEFYKWQEYHGMIKRQFNIEKTKYLERVFLSGCKWYCCGFDERGDIEIREDDWVIIFYFASRCTKNYISGVVGHIPSGNVYHLKNGYFTKFLKYGWCAPHDTAFDIEAWYVKAEIALARLVYKDEWMVPINVTHVPTSKTKGKMLTVSYQRVYSQWRIAPGPGKNLSELVADRQKDTDEASQKRANKFEEESRKKQQVEAQEEEKREKRKSNAEKRKLKQTENDNAVADAKKRRDEAALQALQRRNDDLQRQLREKDDECKRLNKKQSTIQVMPTHPGLPYTYSHDNLAQKNDSSILTSTLHEVKLFCENMKETMTSNNNRKNSGSVIDETIADAERKLKQQLLGKLKDRENELIAVEAERKEKAIEKKELYTQEQEKLVDQRKSGLVDREWKRNCAKEDREWESEEAEKKLQRDFDRAEKKAQAEFTRELAL